MTLDEPGAAVEIGGKTFTVGAVYDSGREVMGRRSRLSAAEAPRRLLAYDPAFPWVGGRVKAVRVEGRGRQERRLDMSGRAWAAWAKETTER